MPKSRRRKSKDALKDAKNVVRGSLSIVDGLSRARPITPTGKLNSLADWTLRSFRLGDFATSLRPRRVSELLSPYLLEPVSLDAELQWDIAIFEKFVPAIEGYISARELINKALVTGERDVVEKELNELSQKVGPSFFEIQTRIGARQIFEGLERQKSLISDLRKLKPTRNVKFFAYWWGVRAEDGHTANSFLAEIEGRSAKWDLKGGLMALIQFHLTRQIPDEEGEHLLLSAASSTPIIDFYETFIAVASCAIAEGRGTKSLFIGAVRSLSQKISDSRLLSLLSIEGDVSAIQSLKLGSHQRQDAEAAGRVTAQEVAPAEIEEWRALVAGGSLALVDENLFGQRLQRALQSALGLSLSSWDFAAEVRKLGLIFRGLPVGDWCWWFGEGERLAAPLRPRVSERSRVISQPALYSSSLTSLPEKVRAQARRQLGEHGVREALISADAAHGDSAQEHLLAPRVRFEVRLQRLLAGAEHSEDLLALAKSLRNDHRILCRRAVFTEIDALLTLNRTDEAITSAGQLIVEQQGIVDWFPADGLAHSLVPTKEGASARSIYLSICLDALVRAGRADLVPERFYAVEDFLASQGISRPTALSFEGSNLPHDAQVYFFANLCTPAILKLSVAYGTEQELKEDRLTLCKRLAAMDPANADTYEAEARSIVRDGLIRKALDQIQRSKISIDEEALRLWAERNLRQEYERYRALLASGVVVVDETFRKALYEAYEAGDVSKTVLNIPQNEASEIFQSLVARLFFELALSSEHGLDSYLSVRIRHGTISGLVRSPSEAERLVTRKAAGTTYYKSNSYWIGQLTQQGIAGDVIEAVDRRLGAFSSDLDAAIRELTDKYIQVERVERPDGLFMLQMAAASVFALALEVSAQTPFVEFYVRATSYFWTLVENSLERVRKHIDDTFRASVRQRFDKLEAELEGTCGPGACAYLIDAVRRSRTETMHAVDRMLEWFTLPTPLARLQMEYDELVGLAEATIRSLHPQFQPNISVDSADVPALEGLHRQFDDIFFIVFENVILRSGNEQNPLVKVRAWMADDCLITRVENEVTSEALPFAIAGVAAAKEKISTGAYLSSVQKETGSGLPKLLKLIQLKPADPHFDFGIDAETRSYFIQFPLYLLQRTEPVS